jgi:hypothetical protein
VLIDAQSVGAVIATVGISRSTPSNWSAYRYARWPIRPASCRTRHFLAATRPPSIPNHNA